MYIYIYTAREGDMMPDMPWALHYAHDMNLTSVCSKSHANADMHGCPSIGMRPHKFIHRHA